MRQTLTNLADSHIFRAAAASFWNYSGRLIGLAWTALLISTLGVSEYGKYAIGIAAAAIINAGIDNAFFVRALRIDEESFERERCARVLFGVTIAALGVACYIEWYIVGFAIVIAAGELLFNTYKSQFLRRGRPDIAMRFEASRQLASVALGASYVFFAHDPLLSVVTLLYVVPYAVILLVNLAYVPGRRPAPPGGLKEISQLSSEAFAAAVYGQGDLLVIGIIAGDRIAGMYSLALVSALAISAIGQNYANTYIDKLRATAGHADSAPAFAHTAWVALGTSSVMVVVGVSVLVWGKADLVGVLFLVLSVVVFLRTINHVLIVILFIQRRDALRVRATVVAAVVKIGALFAAVYFAGAYGAAVTSVAMEAALLFVYYRSIYRGRAPGGSRGEVVLP